MHHAPYDYNQEFWTQYSFTSTGKRAIPKLVEFTPTDLKTVYNLGFGDKLPNGGIDDKANSNNGDLIKVLATIIDIIQDFTQKNPNLTIAFTGSTLERTRLYNRIIRANYESLRTIFNISGLVETENGINEMIFSPYCTSIYLVFFIKRI